MKHTRDGFNLAIRRFGLFGLLLIFTTSCASETKDLDAGITTTSAEPTASATATVASTATTTTAADVPVASLDPAAGAQVFPPPAGGAGSAPIPLVVLVPGGGWVEADPSGLVPLARELSSRGAFVATVTYRTAGEEAYFPTPVHDIACGVAFATASDTDAGFQASELIIVGHSSGAQLAAALALSDIGNAANCEFEYSDPDRLVGLAGPYDVVRASGLAHSLFGPDNPDSAKWSAGDPMQLAANRPQMPVLLVHGLSDDVVPTWFTEQFAAALEDGGHGVTALYPDRADHFSIFSAELAGPIIAEWLGLDADG